MAASITLNVTVNKAKATADLGAIEAQAQKIAATPAVININVKGAANAANTLAKIELQAEKTRQAHEKTIQSANRLATAQEKTAQSANRLSTEQEKTAQSANRVATEQEKTAQSANRLATEQEKTAQSANRLAIEQEKTARATLNASNAAQSAASGWSVFGGAVASAIGYLASRAIHFALQKMVQGLRDALTEMKNVDTELTNISKVSGKTGDELERIGDAAYDTASKYGVAASEYLSAVYDMQKAGMGDQSEAMGELAVKTMLVGDTTKDVASKFLLSANAAWKLEGNMESLSKIVDEADYINNNYATNLDKLASGMPIVASVAAQAGMSAEETMAALGTITHVTQESGTKAATALRALILNISGQVGKFVTEEGEEFEVTAESVKSLQGLLEKYAKTEMDAAKAAGELVNPMTAIQALFKGMAESDLNDVELFNLLSSMGGKLRTNQLTALVRNYGLFDEMLGKIADSAGTADNEIGLMMQSWERKSQVLKNTWTELVADVVDTNVIKSGIDTLIGFVDGIDDAVNRVKNPFFDSGNTLEEIGDVEDKIQGIRDKLAEIGKDGVYDDTALKNLQLELEIQQQILELKQKQYRMEHEEEAQKLQRKLTEANPYFDAAHMAPELQTADSAALWSLNRDVNNVQYENAAQYQDALKGIAGATKDYYEQLTMVRDVLGEGKLTDAQKEFIRTWEEVNAASTAEGLHVDGLVDGIDGATDAYYRLVDAEGNVIAYTENTSQNLREQINAIDERNRAQEESAEAQENASQSAVDYFVAVDTAMANSLGGAQELTSEEGNATEAATGIADAAGGISFDSGTESAAQLVGQLQLAKALAGSISMGPLGFGVGFATGTTSAPGGPTLVNELGPELISENGKAYIANGGRPGVVNLSKGAIVLPTNVTKEALRSGNRSTKAIHAAALGVGKVDTTSAPKNLSPTVAYGAVMYNGANIANLAGSSQNLIIIPPSNKKGPNTITNKSTGKSGKGGSSGGGGGGSTAKSVEELAKETKDILSNIEKQAKLADNRKQYDKEVSLWEKGQKEIDKMVAQYKKAGYKETDDEIIDLLNKRYDYEKKKEAASKKTIEEAADELKDKLSNLDKQAKLANTEGDYTKEVQFYETAQEAIAEMVDRYRKAGYSDDSAEILDLLQKNYDYADKQVKVYKDRWNELIDALEADTEAQEVATKLAEKEQALEDARLALENANKQRTVRTYNAATGQWEWVADQSKVKSAQESLTKAEEGYAEAVKDQAIKELERLRDTMADLNDVILGPALTAVMMKAESSDEFQNFARALNSVYGVGSFLASTEGSSRVMSTADSHDTIYTFGNVTLTEEQASSMSVAQLAQKLQVLKIS